MSVSNAHEDLEYVAETGEEIAVALLLERLEARRDSLIMELRAIERILIRYDRLKSESIPRRHR